MDDNTKSLFEDRRQNCGDWGNANGEPEIDDAQKINSSDFDYRRLKIRPKTLGNHQIDDTFWPATSTGCQNETTITDSESPGKELKAEVDENDKQYPLIYFPLKHLKSEIYENNEGQVIARILGVRPVDQSTVSVTFFEKDIEIKFKTTDEKFLQSHGQNSDVYFIWKSSLYDYVIPCECFFHVQKVIEITLTKKNKAKKWYSLTDVVKKQAKIEENVNGPIIQNGGEPSTSRQETNSCNEKEAEIDNRITANQNQLTSSEETEIDIRRRRHRPGFTGLRNLGNTCFMNATLQILFNTLELRQFFLEDLFYSDLNVFNVLGMKGELAKAFADLTKRVWSGDKIACEPSTLKELMQLKSSQFGNFGQHDAQEFLSFLLDGLHEDLNRVTNKPFSEDAESAGQSDQDLAELSWSNYKARNDSLIVDLFHGQLKSRLICPDCNKVSIKFDPFVYLPVCFPKYRRKLSIYYWPADFEKKPRKHTLQLSEDCTILDLKIAIARSENCDYEQLRIMETYNHDIFKHYENIELIKALPVEGVHAFNVCEDEEKFGSAMYEIEVVQKLARPRSVIFSCGYCGADKADLKACTGCYVVGYCDRSCQVNHWKGHRHTCKKPYDDLIGEPFILSFDKEEINLSHLYQLLEARSRWSVTYRCQCSFRNTDYNDNCAQDSVKCENNDGKVVDDISDSSNAVNKNSDCSSPTGSIYCTDKHSAAFLVQITRKKSPTNEEYSLDGGDITINLTGINNVTMVWRNRNRFLTIVEKRRLDCESINCGTGTHAYENDLKLEDLLKSFTETEKLKPQEAWYCNVCKKHQEAEKTMLLWKLPPLLIIQLKRFGFGGSIFRSKIDTAVQYPLNGLDLKQYLCAGAPPQCTLYDLYGVVCHFGSVYFGHYISYGRLMGVDSADLKWRRFDDTEVSICNESEVVNESAYLLFYARRDSNASHILDTYRSKKWVGHKDQTDFARLMCTEF